MQEPFSSNSFYTERRIFAPNDKLSNKNGHISAWRDLKKKFYVMYYTDMVNETLS
jgi:hypothetical protein